MKRDLKSIFLGGALCLLGLAVAIGGPVSLEKFKESRRVGLPVEGTVLSISQGTNDRYYLNYYFRLPGKNTIVCSNGYGIAEEDDPKLACGDQKPQLVNVQTWRKYSPGDSITVNYDPTDPWKSEAAQEYVSAWKLVLAGLFLLGVGLVILLTRGRET